MRALTKLRLRLRSLFLRDRANSDLDEEIRFHFEEQVRENLATGMPPAEARRAAARQFGNTGLIEEECREMRGTGVLEGIARDLRYGVRVLCRNPAFAVASIAVLALGIGAATAIVSAAHAVLARPLPFPEPDRLVRLWDSYGSPGNMGPVSYPNFADWRAWSSTFDSMAAFQERSYVLTGDGDPIALQALAASANFLDVLGVHPALGRGFRPEEDTPGANGGADSVLLSDRLWRTRFQADTAILGRRITLAHTPFVVIGVMPPNFDSYTGSGEIDLWLTLAVAARPVPGMEKPLIAVRTISFLGAVGRLKPGVTMQQARSDLDRVAKLLERNYPGDDPRDGVTVIGLQASATAAVRPMLIVLLWAAGALLVIACADVGGLGLARVARRRHEMSLRASLGAGRWRLLRQLFAESLVLSTCAAAAGALLAKFVSSLLAVFLGLDPDKPILEPGALAFAVALSTLAALAVSMIPAVYAARCDVIQGLKTAAAAITVGTRQKRLQSALVVAQIALSTVLLSACGLLALNLRRLEHASIGFDPQHTFTFRIALPNSRYPQPERAQFLDRLIDQLRALPGVEAVSASSQMPFRGYVPRTVLSSVNGKPIELLRRVGIGYSPITPEFFRALGIPVRAGRAFTAADTAHSDPVVILNEAAAHHYFGKVDPIGRQVQPEMWNGSGSVTQPRTVVGVVGDLSLQRAGERPVDTVYWPVSQIPSESVYWIAIRTPGDPLSVASAARARLREADRDLVFGSAAPLADAVAVSFVQPRHNTALVAAFALLALILTATGLYGTIAYSVSNRTREIGIRIALGAARADVYRQFVRFGLAMGIAGIAAGLIFAKAAAQLMKSLVFGASLDQPVAFAVSAAALFVIAFAASFLPSRRAARIDPMRALRSE